MCVWLFSPFFSFTLVNSLMVSFRHSLRHSPGNRKQAENDPQKIQKPRTLPKNDQHIPENYQKKQITITKEYEKIQKKREPQPTGRK
jgi:hypothetical protein